jgi:MAE_28990/MAE_18760-like HEPN
MSFERLENDLIKQRDFHLSEIRTLQNLILNSNKLNAEEKQILIRQFISLVYSHWEGFVKSAFSIYTKEINKLCIKSEELNQNLLINDLKLKYESLNANMKPDKFNFNEHLQRITNLNTYFTQQIELSSSIKGSKSIIEYTDINKLLKSFCLKELEQNKFQKWLEQLCKDRNLIAHGDFQDISDQPIERIKELSNFLEDTTAEILTRIYDGYRDQSFKR